LRSPVTIASHRAHTDAVLKTEPTSLVVLSVKRIKLHSLELGTVGHASRSQNPETVKAIQVFAAIRHAEETLK
jgi:hypothetical protein